jgi:hypothetical protein
MVPARPASDEMLTIAPGRFLAGFGAGQHASPDGLGPKKRAGEMDVQDLAPLYKAHFLDHRGAGNAGIVDQAMYSAEGLGDPLHCFRRKCRLGNVAL